MYKFSERKGKKMNAFKTERLSEHLIRITDITEVCCYLVVGTERACLLDTCLGYGDLLQCVRELTDLPVSVILTHGHYDHNGGAAQFDTVYMNEKELPVYKKHTAPEWRNALRLQSEAVRTFPEQEIIPYADPSGFLTLEDGQRFPLGGVTVRMIEVPGHTPGMMCPLLEEDRTIIFGDACGVGVLLFDEFSSTVSEYRKSLLKLKEYEADYDRIYRNHGSFRSEKELLDNVIECCDLILSGKDDHVPVSEHGYPLFSAKKLADGHRADGKEGNIKYAPEKAV